MMSTKQKAFADHYIRTGNATEAARLAGYSEKSARQMGAENLSKPYISAYIQSRLEQIEAGRMADAQEVMIFYTSVMRGEAKDAFGLECSLSDRLKAADAIMKRISAAESGQRGTLDRLDAMLKEMRDAAE